MKNTRSPHFDGANSVKRGQDLPKPRSALLDTSSFNLEIEAPGGKVKLNAQGQATIVFLFGLLLVGSLAGIGGFLFLKGNQFSLPAIESRK